jgi:tRNA dimethylallyltransferase
MLVVAIVGPTASGKSALAVEVALQCTGEIVNTDSMQAYVGMEIGTAKPPQAEWRGVPHHVFSEWPPDHELSVAEFQAAARSAIEAVAGRGAVPIAVGGSGLYVSAVLDDLRFPGTEPAIRGALEAQLDLVGPEAMHAQLAAVDPAAAAAILPSNGRRIVRALEVIEITGEPFIATLPPPVGIYPTIRIGLEIPRDVLDVRIEARVAQMWADGFVAEVEGLVARSPQTKPGKPPSMRPASSRGVSSAGSAVTGASPGFPTIRLTPPSEHSRSSRQEPARSTRCRAGGAAGARGRG